MKNNTERLKQLEKQKRRCWLTGLIFGLSAVIIKNIIECWDSESGGLNFSNFLLSFSYRDLISFAIASAVYAVIIRYLAISEIENIQTKLGSKSKQGHKTERRK